MAVEELLLYFLVAPAVGYASSAFWVRRTMRKIAERQLGFLRETQVNSRYFVFLALFATPIVFGLLLFMQSAQVLPYASPNEAVLRTLGWTFALAAILAVLSEAWIVVRWKAASFGDMFGRVLVLTVIPETVIVWTLNIAVLALGLLARDSTEPPISQGSADAITRSLEIMMIGIFAAPLSAFLANRQPVLNATTFRRVLVWAVLGDVLGVVALAFAIAGLPRA